MTEATLLTTSQAAEILGVTPTWAGALCRSGGLRAEKKGKYWQIEKSSVLELAESRKKPVPKEELEAVDREISENELLKEYVEKKAEKSFMDEVLRLAKKYSPEVGIILAGFATAIFLPGCDAGRHIIMLGFTSLLRKLNEKKEELNEEETLNEKESFLMRLRRLFFP